MEKLLKKVSKKCTIIFLILIFNIILNGMKLSEIEGLKSLSNYDEIKDINVERIVDYDNYERNKEKDRVYVNGESEPFTGAAIEKKNNRIVGIYIYINGKSEGKHYSYFDNGQLLLETQEKNDKSQGEGYEYYPNGNLKDKRIYKDNIIIDSVEYYQNGKIRRIFKTTEGLKGIIVAYYEDGIHKSSEMSVIQDYSIKDKMNYIMDGESTAYDKKGQIMGILNYKDGKLTGLEQKVFKNGKLKYDYISASEKPEENVKAKDFFIEYFDNSEQKKLDCKELASNNWRCKEYSKNGKFKREFDSPTFEKPRDWSFGINALLGILNILF